MELQQRLPFTILKLVAEPTECRGVLSVATAPTVYGIETTTVVITHGVIVELQQHLPFTVLKRICPIANSYCIIVLQQYLPFTVLKHFGPEATLFK